MTLDFAVTRVFELESKQDVVLNRMMINNYLESLKKGLNKNTADYLQQNAISSEQLQAQHAEKRFVDFAQKAQAKQFEMQGYEKMLARILEAPMKSSEASNNLELQ